MKQGLYLAFVYIGLVIGAGFASGREIMEYFNIPSGRDHSGIVLATFLLIVICYMILRRAYLSDLSTCDEYLHAVAGRAARPIKLLMQLYLFCGFFTMLSGSGALLSQSLMLPSVLGNFLLAFICFLVLVFDLRGVVTVNLVLVPCMIFGIIYICLCTAVFGAKEAFSFHSLTRGMLTSAICYVSYNTISAPSVLVPLQKGITVRGIRIAAVGGGFVLGLLILCIWLSQSLCFDVLWDSPLPMLKLAAMAGRRQKQLYALVLFMAICTTAVSQGFGILSGFHLTTRRQKAYGAGVLCLLALPFSLVGFSDLVAQLYSFFGVAGLVLTIVITIDFIRGRES